MYLGGISALHINFQITNYLNRRGAVRHWKIIIFLCPILPPMSDLTLFYGTFRTRTNSLKPYKIISDLAPGSHPTTNADSFRNTGWKSDLNLLLSVPGPDQCSKGEISKQRQFPRQSNSKLRTFVSKRDTEHKKWMFRTKENYCKCKTFHTDNNHGRGSYKSESKKSRKLQIKNTEKSFVPRPTKYKNNRTKRRKF